MEEEKKTISIQDYADVDYLSDLLKDYHAKHEKAMWQSIKAQNIPENSAYRIMRGRYSKVNIDIVLLVAQITGLDPLEVFAGMPSVKARTKMHPARNQMNTN